MVGKKILHYQLIEKIGAGGMGEIYKGQDSRLNRLVAVKILSPGLSNDPERKRRFFQEAQAASALNHPNIITLYDIVTEGDMQCIVMEYIAGKTLRELTPTGGLRPPMALQYSAQIASALTTAHAAGIIHRDLKPSNIMVTNTGLIKVLDFGLAKWVDSNISGQTGEQSTMETALTREGSIIGTVSYMSPEQAEGKRVDARSDIFSFGSVLYEMLTGRRAFEGRSGISTLSAILRDDVKPIYETAPDVPPMLEQIVLRCLPKDPTARWQSMREIEVALLALQRHLDPEGLFASPVPPAHVPAALDPVATVAPSRAPAPPSAAAAVSTGSDPSVEEAPPVAAPLNGGPAKQEPAIAASATETRKAAPTKPPVPPPSSKDIPKPPVPRAARTSAGASRKVTALVFGLLGIILVATAAVSGWYLWTSRHRPAPVAQATAPPAETAVIPKPEPFPAPTPPPVETPPPAAATPAPTSDAASKDAKAKQKAKPKPTVDSLPATPPPTQPTQPAPAPAVAIPPPPPPTPAPPKPVIQTTPITVADSLPFVITLMQDVPSDAPGGQALRFVVNEDLRVGDKTVVPKGATVTGEVVGEKGKKILGIGGKKLTFRLTKAETVDGREIAVRAIAGKSAEGPSLRAFDTGKGSKSKGYAAMQGTIYVGYVDGDQMVAVRK